MLHAKTNSVCDAYLNVNEISLTLKANEINCVFIYIYKKTA